MVLGLNSQVLEYRVGPEALHEILCAISVRLFFLDMVSYPIVYLTVTDGVVDAISRTSGRSKSFVANEEVQVFCTSLSREMSARSSATGQERRLVRDRRAS